MNTDICPICGKPHGKGMPNTALNPAVAPDVVPPEPVEVVEPAEVVEEIVALEEVGDVVDEPEPEPELESELAYSDMGIKQLRRLAKNRGIKQPFGASKADIIALLEE
jgi:hypothetical protein